MTSSSGFQVAGSAPDYYERFNAVIMAPFIRAVIDAAALQPGAAVLDVACGTGLATRAAAAAVGSSGRVAGLDLNPGMIAKASGLVIADGAASVDWHEGSALDLPFADGEFNAVLCQQGIQFFPDLPLAAREMARVSAPGAHVAASFWAPLEAQTYMRAQLHGVRDAIGDAAASIEIGFRLDPERAADAFAAAGFHDVETRQVVATVALPPLEEFALPQLGALPVGPAMSALPAERQGAYLQNIRDALQAYRNPDGGYDCPFASWLVIGVR